MAKKRSHRGRNGHFSADVDDETEVDADGEDEIIVVDEEGNVVNDDTPNATAEPVVAFDMPPEPAADPKPRPAPDDAMAALQRNYDAVVAERDAARADAQQSRTRASTVERDQHDTTLSMLKGAHAQAKQSQVAARKALAAGMASGDADAVADAQIALNDARLSEREYADAIAEFEANPPQEQRREPQPRQQQPATYDAAVEMAISSFTPATQEFARKHKAALFPANGDQSPMRKAGAYHNVALAEGLAQDTPEYFDFLSEKLGLEERTPENDPQPKPKTKQRRPTMAAAPVSRAGAANGGQPRQVTLSADEREMAKRLGMSAARYASHKQKALDRGKDPNYSGPRYSRDDPSMRGR